MFTSWNAGRIKYSSTEIQAPPGDRPGASGCPRDGGAVWRHTATVALAHHWGALGQMTVSPPLHSCLLTLVDSPTLYGMKATSANRSCSRLELTQHFGCPSILVPCPPFCPQTDCVKDQSLAQGRQNPMGSQDWLASRTRSSRWCPPPPSPARGHSHAFISGSAHRVTAVLLVLALLFRASFSFCSLLVHNVCFLVRIPREGVQWALLAGQSSLCLGISAESL